MSSADGKSAFRDKLESLALGGRKPFPKPVVRDGVRHVPIRHEQDGGVAGVAHETSDRRDVDIFGRSAVAGGRAR